MAKTPPDTFGHGCPTGRNGLAGLHRRADVARPLSAGDVPRIDDVGIRQVVVVWRDPSGHRHCLHKQGRQTEAQGYQPAKAVMPHVYPSRAQMGKSSSAHRAQSFSDAISRTQPRVEGTTPDSGAGTTNG